MNKILLIATKVAFIAVLFALFAPSAYAKVDNSVYTDVSKNDLKERIESLHSAVDLRYTEEVHGIINNYIKRYRRSTERLLGLSEQFFPLYEAELNKQGLPHELKYLSVVESGLKPTAISVSGAAGLWQFMKGTGRLYGLKINDVVDERRDPIRSTQAASQYLKDLHEQFGDWTLALAAYNCGPGNVRKALRRSQEEEFWSMKTRGYLPKETRRYIPKYVAMSYLMNYSHVHNLRPDQENSPHQLATVRIYDYTTFSKISKITGLNKMTIAEYNPAYIKGYIPRSSQGYYLTLPQSDLYYYLSQVGGFEHLLDLGYDSSTLRGRYMLYGAMKKKVEELNSLAVITTKAIGSEDPINDPIRLPLQTAPLSVLNSEGRTYQMKPKESLIDVAEANNIKLSTLLKINDIDVSSPLEPGAVIRLD